MGDDDGRSRSRRRALIEGATVLSGLGLAGCSATTGDDIQDTDGDGVIDSEDYAPRDPDIQRKDQLQEGDSARTDSPTPTDTESPTPTPTPGVRVIDDFESGKLEQAWRSEFDTSETRTGSDGGRSAYRVQSGIAPEGSYALRGNKDLYEDGTSTVLRDDFEITRDGATVSLYVRLGRLLTDYERDNRVTFFASDLESRVVVFRDKPGDWENPIVSEKLATANLVEIENISFSDSVIGEVRIGGEVVASNLPFADDADDIGAVQLRQGHYNQPADIVVDDIRIEYPDGETG